MTCIFLEITTADTKLTVDVVGEPAIKIIPLQNIAKNQ